MMAALLALALAQALPSTPDLGTADARCRADEPGPAILIEVRGLKDRMGLLRAELYPDDDQDFLADDNALVAQRKIFRRVDLSLTHDAKPRLCLRVPAPGSYTLAVLHDRNGDHKFQPWQDGAGFPGNPRLGWSRPKASAARVMVGSGVTTISIVMNYLHGVAFGPLASAPPRAAR